MACTTSAILEVNGSLSRSLNPCRGFSRICGPCFGTRRSIIGAEGDRVPNLTTLRTTRLRKLAHVLADSRPTKTQEISGDDDLLITPEAKSGELGNDVAEYDWEQEWYPMYLASEMPKSAPLGLTVFDKPLVLFYDDKGVLNCFEDRCPHRFLCSLLILFWVTQFVCMFRKFSI